MISQALVESNQPRRQGPSFQSWMDKEVGEAKAVQASRVKEKREYEEGNWFSVRVNAGRRAGRSTGGADAPGHC